MIARKNATIFYIIGILCLAICSGVLVYHLVPSSSTHHFSPLSQSVADQVPQQHGLENHQPSAIQKAKPLISTPNPYLTPMYIGLSIIVIVFVGGVFYLLYDRYLRRENSGFEHTSTLIITHPPDNKTNNDHTAAMPSSNSDTVAHTIGANNNPFPGTATSYNPPHKRRITPTTPIEDKTSIATDLDGHLTNNSTHSPLLSTIPSQNKETRKDNEHKAPDIIDQDSSSEVENLSDNNENQQPQATSTANNTNDEPSTKPPLPAPDTANQQPDQETRADHNPLLNNPINSPSTPSQSNQQKPNTDNAQPKETVPIVQDNSSHIAHFSDSSETQQFQLLSIANDTNTNGSEPIKLSANADSFPPEKEPLSDNGAHHNDPINSPSTPSQSNQQDTNTDNEQPEERDNSNQLGYLSVDSENQQIQSLAIENEVNTNDKAPDKPALKPQANQLQNITQHNASTQSLKDTLALLKDMLNGLKPKQKPIVSNATIKELLTLNLQSCPPELKEEWKKLQQQTHITINMEYMYVDYLAFLLALLENAKQGIPAFNRLIQILPNVTQITWKNVDCIGIRNKGNNYSYDVVNSDFIEGVKNILHKIVQESQCQLATFIITTKEHPIEDACNLHVNAFRALDWEIAKVAPTQIRLTKQPNGVSWERIIQQGVIPKLKPIIGVKSSHNSNLTTASVVRILSELIANSKHISPNDKQIWKNTTAAQKKININLRHIYINHKAFMPLLFSSKYKNVLLLDRIVLLFPNATQVTCAHTDWDGDKEAYSSDMLNANFLLALAAVLKDLKKAKTTLAEITITTEKHSINKDVLDKDKAIFSQQGWTIKKTNTTINLTKKPPKKQRFKHLPSLSPRTRRKKNKDKHTTKSKQSRSHLKIPDKNEPNTTISLTKKKPKKQRFKHLPSLSPRTRRKKNKDKHTAKSKQSRSHLKVPDKNEPNTAISLTKKKPKKQRFKHLPSLSPRTRRKKNKDTNTTKSKQSRSRLKIPDKNGPNTNRSRSAGPLKQSADPPKKKNSVLAKFAALQNPLTVDSHSS